MRVDLSETIITILSKGIIFETPRRITHLGTIYQTKGGFSRTTSIHKHKWKNENKTSGS